MPTLLNQNTFLTPVVDEPQRTRVDSDSPVTRNHVREKWQDIIDRKLIEWGRNPDQLDDIGVEPPSGEVIGIAIALAMAFRDEDFDPPDSVVPDANGGIVFRRSEKDITESYHIWEDGKVEYQQFRKTKIVVRRTI